MATIRAMFLDLWVLIKTVWGTLRAHHRGFTLLLLLVCLLMATLRFGFWALVGLLLLLILGVFLKDLVPVVTDRRARLFRLAMLTIVVIAGTYSLYVISGAVLAILILAAIIYFGLFAK